MCSCHTVILQAGDYVHVRFGHVLLCEYDGELLGAVVAVVEEDDHVAGLYCTVERAVYYWFDKLVCHAFVIGLLHGLHHVGSHAALAVHQQFVGLLDAFPTFVPVHGIETAHDGSDAACRLLAVLLQLLYEALAALGVCVATVHEAVYEGAFLQSVFVGYVAQLVEVVERRVYASVRCQAHEVNILSLFFGVGEGGYYFGVFQYAAVGARTVDFHQVLVDDASGTDVEVAYFGIAHLPVGESDVFAACLKL